MDKYLQQSFSFFILFLFLNYSLLIHTVYGVTDIITTDQGIRDGETLISSDGMFELGFFGPGNLRNRYVGIWYKNVPVRTVVWVANRDIPLTNTTGVVLKVINPGLLVLLNETNGVIWSSNTSRSVQNPVAQFLNDGNLVVRDANDENPENFLWQSFDYMSDTYLPGMKCGWNLKTGLETYFTSWRAEDDPSTGEFTVHLDPTGYPQILVKRGSHVVHRSGPWNGLGFSGLPYAKVDPSYRMGLVMNENEVRTFRYSIDNSVISVTRLNPDGVVQRLTWVDRTQEWVISINIPADNCDSYDLCGMHGVCDVENTPSCECLNKFVPNDREGWVKADWSSGCVRRTNLSCNGDVFLKYSGIKLPDARHSWLNESMTLDECEAECLRNCSCTAYTQLDISKGGSGCLLYFGELVDIRRLYQDGQDLYIRMASSELEHDSESKRKRWVIFIVIVSSVVGVGSVGLGIFLCVQKMKKKGPILRKKGSYGGNHAKETDLPLIKLSTILKATDQFSLDNKLGEGGFGPVYKGVLEEGQEIAVKRLSKTSKQGADEFMNEVMLIAQLQHRNLVRLLGCCIEGEETMLIYEYMPNKSLDKIIFDKTKSALLDWPTRFHIILGIARGLLYLHQDSRLRIIHRDLKTSNILLDSEMNPKISDFGMAKSFGGNETGAETSRVVGTFGYISPEYAMDGIFSLKSDVFSFGVILLEIISGKRNRGYSHYHNLLGHAWTLHKEDRSQEIFDIPVDDSLDVSEVLRSIHVGLLCVQRCPEDRPSMSSVVFMLENEAILPEPKQPGCFLDVAFSGDQKLNETNTRPMDSVNDLTITIPEGR